jgi:hypothetical protein
MTDRGFAGPAENIVGTVHVGEEQRGEAAAFECLRKTDLVVEILVTE